MAQFNNRVHAAHELYMLGLGLHNTSTYFINIITRPFFVQRQ